jgi:Right handed beta helix region
VGELRFMSYDSVAINMLFVLSYTFNIVGQNDVLPLSMKISHENTNSNVMEKNSLPGFKSDEYYIDANNGNDINSGHSPQSAWQTLKKVNQTVFQPGDKIFFKSGDSWGGQLELRGSGTPAAPIQINKYGEGKKPAIYGKGEKLHTILLHNVEYWEVRHLEITNMGNNRGDARRGVIVRAVDFGDCHHIVLDSLEIHHVNGSLVKSKGGGSAILWQNGGDSLKTRFVGLQITNCHLHHCERNGINSRGYTNRKEWHPSLGVVIRNNLLEQIPGDGIVPIGTDGALIEYNIMRDCPDILSHEEAAAGIWPWSADNTIIQYNEVSGHRAKWDGQGFDSDWNCQNTIIQYNYSHDNYGGFLLVCNDGSSVHTDKNIGTVNTIVRYNVSVNDGIRPYETSRKSWFAPTIHISGPVENTKMYNNVFIIPEKAALNRDRTIVHMDNWGGPWPENTFFANNIFYVAEKADFFFKGDRGTIFTGNCFYGKYDNMPVDPNAIFENPRFVNVFARGNGFEVLKNFMLRENTPCIHAGLGLENDVNHDLFRKIINSK